MIVNDILGLCTSARSCLTGIRRNGRRIRSAQSSLESQVRVLENLLRNSRVRASSVFPHAVDTVKSAEARLDELASGTGAGRRTSFLGIRCTVPRFMDTAFGGGDEKIIDVLGSLEDEFRTLVSLVTLELSAQTANAVSLPSEVLRSEIPDDGTRRFWSQNFGNDLVVSSERFSHVVDKTLCNSGKSFSLTDSDRAMTIKSIASSPEGVTAKDFARLVGKSTVTRAIDHRVRLIQKQYTLMGMDKRVSDLAVSKGTATLFAASPSGKILKACLGTTGLRSEKSAPKCLFCPKGHVVSMAVDDREATLIAATSEHRILFVSVSSMTVMMDRAMTSTGDVLHLSARDGVLAYIYQETGSVICEVCLYDTSKMEVTKVCERWCLHDSLFCRVLAGGHVVVESMTTETIVYSVDHSRAAGSASGPGEGGAPGSYDAPRGSISDDGADPRIDRRKSCPGRKKKFLCGEHGYYLVCGKLYKKDLLAPASARDELVYTINQAHEVVSMDVLGDDYAFILVKGGHTVDLLVVDLNDEDRFAKSAIVFPKFLDEEPAGVRICKSNASAPQCIAVFTWNTPDITIQYFDVLEGEFIPVLYERIPAINEASTSLAPMMPRRFLVNKIEISPLMNDILITWCSDSQFGFLSAIVQDAGTPDIDHVKLGLKISCQDSYPLRRNWYICLMTGEKTYTINTMDAMGRANSKSEEIDGYPKRLTVTGDSHVAIQSSSMWSTSCILFSVDTESQSLTLKERYPNKEIVCGKAGAPILLLRDCEKGCIATLNAETGAVKVFPEIYLSRDSCGTFLGDDRAVIVQQDYATVVSSPSVVVMSRFQLATPAVSIAEINGPPRGFVASTPGGSVDVYTISPSSDELYQMVRFSTHVAGIVAVAVDGDRSVVAGERGGVIWVKNNVCLPIFRHTSNLRRQVKRTQTVPRLSGSVSGSGNDTRAVTRRSRIPASPRPPPSGSPGTPGGGPAPS
jgi:hypothetical protein